MKKSLNQYQVVALQQHLREFESNLQLTESFVYEDMNNMILYTGLSSNKIVKGAVFI